MKRLLVLILPFIFAACSLIDDDLTVCSDDLVIGYQVQLSTELSMQLQTELMVESEAYVRNALSSWLAPVFTDRAHDLDLRFYSVRTEQERYRIQEIIDDNRTSYTFQLPKESYKHLAVVNIVDNPQVQLSGSEHLSTMSIQVPEKENQVPPFTTGVFTARMPMEIGDSSENFSVRLYMASAAVAVVIDTTSCEEMVDVTGYMSGAANAFMVDDSVFLYDRPCPMSFEYIPISTDTTETKPWHKMPRAQIKQPYVCYGTVSFPTQDGEEWKVSLMTTLTDDRHTTTTFTLKKTLTAGTLRIIKTKMDEKGTIVPIDTEQGQEVGVTVELDWTPGSEHEIDI